jgi:predicted alpha/beta-fold hydrolase
MPNTQSKSRLTIPKWLIYLAIALVLLCIIGFFVLGWIGSSKLIAINPQKIAYDQTITAIENNHYTTRGSAYNINGVVGGIRTDGSMIGIFSAPTNIDVTANTSTRTLTTAPAPVLRVGETISLQGNIWTTDPKTALGLDYRDVTYPSQLGPMNAWLIPGPSATTWVIGVHGVGADKTEMLRFIRPVHTSGNTMLVINYRNDPGNPQSPDKRNNLGDSEWQDVESAVAYAKSQGATDIRLYGDSLGGSLVENYLKRSDTVEESNITKVLLDSPALNWNEVLKAQARKSGYPTFLAYPTKIVLWLRTGISMNDLSTTADQIKHPTLIIHSADDPTVPQNASKHLAAENPLVTLVDFGSGGHLRSWNYDSSRYEKLVTDYLSK